MHDPVDIRRRIERLVARVSRRDDYGQLLVSGQVVHRLEEVEDIEAWRVGIRRHVPPTGSRFEQVSTRDSSGRGYGDVAQAVMGGALFEDECPNNEPPALTGLAMTYIEGSSSPRDSPGGHVEV